MITKYVEFNIICDICDIDGCYCSKVEWHPNTTYDDWNDKIPVSEKGIRDIRKIAKEYGWIHKNRKDICPKCQKK